MYEEFGKEMGEIMSLATAPSKSLKSVSDFPVEAENVDYKMVTEIF